MRRSSLLDCNLPLIWVSSKIGVSEARACDVLLWSLEGFVRRTQRVPLFAVVRRGSCCGAILFVRSGPLVYFSWSMQHCEYRLPQFLRLDLTYPRVFPHLYKFFASALLLESFPPSPQPSPTATVRTLTHPLYHIDCALKWLYDGGGSVTAAQLCYKCGLSDSGDKLFFPGDKLPLIISCGSPAHGSRGGAA